jgi:hypothetical protein
MTTTTLTKQKAKIQKNIFIEGTGQQGFFTPAGISNQVEGVTSVFVYKGSNTYPIFKTGTERAASYLCAKGMSGPAKMKEFMIEILAPDESLLQICLIAEAMPTLQTTAGDFVFEALDVLHSANSTELDNFMSLKFPVQLFTNSPSIQGDIRINKMPQPIGIVEYENKF